MFIFQRQCYSYVYSTINAGGNVGLCIPVECITDTVCTPALPDLTEHTHINNKYCLQTAAHDKLAAQGTSLSDLPRDNCRTVAPKHGAGEHLDNPINRDGLDAIYECAYTYIHTCTHTYTHVYTFIYVLYTLNLKRL